MPNGIFHVNVYPNKEIQTLTCITPIDDLKKHKHLTFKVMVHRFEDPYISPDEYMEEYVGRFKR